MTKTTNTNKTPTAPSKPERRCRIRVFLQPTGGAGKTTCCVLLAQHLNAQPGKKALAIDLDPGSTSLSNHKTLDTLRIELLDEDAEEVDQLQYKRLLSEIKASPSKGYTDVILDAGAGGFLGLRTWMITQNPFGMLESAGWEVELHYVIPGTGRNLEAYEDLEEMLTSFPHHPMTIWLNPIQERCRLDGKDFLDTDLYHRHKDRIAAVIKLRLLNKALADTMMRMLQHGLTYADLDHLGAIIVEDIRNAMLVDGSKPTATASALAAMPPGLNDELVVTRMATIRQWTAAALAAAPGVL